MTVLIPTGYMAMSSNQTVDDELLTRNSPDDETPDNNNDALIPPSSQCTLRSVIPTLIISILLGLVSGTAYGFGRYARTLKEILGVSQSQVQTLGIFMDCGNYVGHPVVGIIYDRKGPVVSCLLGALIAFVSYWKIRWILLNHHDDDGILLLQLAFFGVGFSSGLGYIAGLGSATKALLRLSSAKYFGTGIGLVAAGCGLSSTLVGLSYQHLPNLPSFFYFWALIVPVVNIGAAAMFQIQASYTNKSSMAQSAEANGPTMEEAGPLLCSPTLETTEAQASQQSNNNMEDESTDESSITLLEAWDSWKQLEFWLLFASFSCATGCGLFVINNLSTMVQSMGGSDSLAGSLVIVLSISNVGGRILMGMIGDYAASSNDYSPPLPRIRLLQAVNLTMALAMILAFIGGQQRVCVIVVVVVVALAYGSAWVLIVALTPQLFGKDNFGKDYGLLALGPAISGMVFNQASAKWYEQHASNNTCIGRKCYGTAYVASMTVALMGVIITGILHKLQRQKDQR